MSTPWARSLNTYEMCSLLLARTRDEVFATHPEARNNKAENGYLLAEKTIIHQTQEMQLTRAHKK